MKLDYAMLVHNAVKWDILEKCYAALENYKYSSKQWINNRYKVKGNAYLNIKLKYSKTHNEILIIN